MLAQPHIAFVDHWDGHLAARLEGPTCGYQLMVTDGKVIDHLAAILLDCRTWIALDLARAIVAPFRDQSTLCERLLVLVPPTR